MTGFPRIPEKERQYYRKTWGFDPVTDAKLLPTEGYFYSQSFRLAADPQLLNDNVYAVARVEINEGSPHNQMIFERENQKAAIECTHTVVYSGAAEKALTYADDLEKNVASNKTDTEFVQAHRGIALLSPWEHFAAMKSYVAAIAEVGLGNIFKDAMQTENSGANSLSFGFNEIMQHQVLNALAKVTPAALKAVVRDAFLKVAENEPQEWLNERFPELAETYGLLEPILEDPQVFDCMADKLDAFLLHDMDAIYGKTETHIKEKIAKLYNNQTCKDQYPRSPLQLVEWLEQNKQLDKGIGRIIREKWRTMALVQEMSDTAPEEDFLSLLSKLSNVIDIREILFERLAVFEHINKSQGLPILRVLAAFYPKTHPAILDYLAKYKPADIGLGDLLHSNPNLWESTKASLARYGPYDITPTYYFCGEELPAKAAFALASIRRCFAPHALLPAKYLDLYRSDHPTKYGWFKIENGNVVELHLGGLKSGFFPSEIWDFPMLQVLDLHENLLEKVPEVTHTMPYIHTLNLSENLLDRLPASLEKLTSVRLLDIHNNYFPHLPEVISNLKKLETIIWK